MRKKIYNIIFETNTQAGRRFDVYLLWLIVASVLLVFMESVPEYGSRFAREFLIAEWIVTILFSIEYVLRIMVSPKPLRYIFSFWGAVDFLAIIPTYLSLVAVGYHYLLTIRIFRLLRVFRILKMVRFMRESEILYNALKASSYKISIFLIAVSAIVISMGTLMYVIEGPSNGFTSIPQSIYWSIVTVTTVGYGDLVPSTVLGKMLSSFIMITGYAIIAVPTGIITVEMSRMQRRKRKCDACDAPNDDNAEFCSHCGAAMPKHEG